VSVGPRALAYVLALAALSGCAKDPAREEAQRDQVALRGIVDAEARVQKAFDDEGHAEKAHRDDEAAGLLETSVLPALEGALSITRATTPESAWGRARRDDMLAALVERKDELPRYVVALRSHDEEAQLASALKQAEIEKHVLRAGQAILDGAGAGKAP
jgi:hypothetical protein